MHPSYVQSVLRNELPLWLIAWDFLLSFSLKIIWPVLDINSPKKSWTQLKTLGNPSADKTHYLQKCLFLSYSGLQDLDAVSLSAVELRGIGSKISVWKSGLCNMKLSKSVKYLGLPRFLNFETCQNSGLMDGLRQVWKERVKSDIPLPEEASAASTKESVFECDEVVVTSIVKACRQKQQVFLGTGGTENLAQDTQGIKLRL